MTFNRGVTGDVIPPYEWRGQGRWDWRRRVWRTDRREEGKEDRDEGAEDMEGGDE